MRNIGVTNKFSYRLRIFGCVLGLLIIFGMGFYVALRSRSDSYYNSIFCATPWIVNPIKGRVITGNKNQPVQNAQVIIQRTSPEEQICPDYTYIKELRLQTDSQGIFTYISGEVAHPDQEFNITISAANCKTYESFNVSFRWFSDANFPAIFPLECNTQ